ncbi:uncharacterized protein LOC120918333 [Rana temporaria]|uniref:uncharacterized protein LOC120918333 n=1 Tax=Rana temporaria TaxID=8407 RepID=UPI001AAD670E|nr:uncharacterized protein LOC120918333 [Rana temporaria]
MNILQKPPTKLTSEVLLSDPVRLWLPHSQSPMKHVEILEIRGIFKKIVKFQEMKPIEDTLMILNNRKKKPINLNKGRKNDYIKKRLSSRKNKKIIGNKKTKNGTIKKIPNGPLMKWNKKKFVEREFGKARRSKRPNKHLSSAKHRKPKEDEMYSEVKRKTPRTIIELFPRLSRNKKQVRKTKVLDRRPNSSSKALERTGLSIPVSPNGDKHQELVHSADGEMFSKEETISTIKNELRRLPIHDDENNTNKQFKFFFEAFATVVTTTFDGLKESVFLTHATTPNSEIVSQRSKELHKSKNNESKSSKSSLGATTGISVIPPTSTQNKIMSTKVTPYMNEIRGDKDSLEKTANRPKTLSWDKRVLELTEALPLTTGISLDHWIKTNLELQPMEIGSGIVDDQIKILLPNNSAFQVESSGDSHIEVELGHRNRTLQVTEPNHVQSTGSTLPYPTDHKGSTLPYLTDHKGSTLPYPTGHKGSTLPYPTCHKGSTLPYPTDQKGSTLPYPTDQKGSTLPYPTGHKGSTLPYPTDHKGSTLPYPTGHKGSTLPYPTDHKGSTLPYPTDHKGSTLPYPTGHKGSTLPYPTDHKGSTLHYPTDHKGSTLPYPTGHKGSTLPYLTDHKGSTLPYPTDHKGSTLPYPTGHKESTLPYPTDQKGSTLPYLTDHKGSTLPYPTGHKGSTLPYPTDHKDGNITNTVTDVSEEIRDNVFRPLEMVMNYGSETTYCKPGYKYYAGACKSMCNMGDFYCENGGQCVIVENLGAMCRCHQTNSLCYRGECCRLSLTPLQLICVIGSCCIFVSVFLGSISLLIRRMDIKAVSKSVRTRLWISTLMPSSRSSSFSHSVASEFTACSEYGSSDPSSFTHNKEVTYGGRTLKCERTRL